MKKDGDGIYYWTLDGEFIIVDGQKIKAQGQMAVTVRMEQTELLPNSKFERVLVDFL